MNKRFNATLAVLVCLVTWAGSCMAVSAQSKASRMYTIDAGTPQGLQALFAPDGGVMPLVSAHRGGAARGFPENCIATFEHTLKYTWSMLEIDLQYTQDGM